MGSCLEFHVAFSSRVSLGSSLLCGFSDFPYFWWSWLCWEVLVRYFLECPPLDYLLSFFLFFVLFCFVLFYNLLFFLWWSWGHGVFLKEDHRDKVSSHCIKVTSHQHDFSPLMLTLIPKLGLLLRITWRTLWLFTALGWDFDSRMKRYQWKYLIQIVQELECSKYH